VADHSSPIVASVVQAGSVAFDTDATIDKLGDLVADARRGGADLVVFPEAFVGGYPKGHDFGAVVGSRTEEGRDWFRRYAEGAIALPGPELTRIADAAAGVHLVAGVIERDGGTLYCSVVFLSPDGRLLGVHRKLMPTAAERLIWGFGDGSTMPVVDTDVGRLGAAICWENYMPLARMAMYGKGVEIYLAPTADARERWQATLQHISLEGRCFVLGCNQYVHRDMYPEDLEMREELESWPEVLSRGGSAIYGPLGELLAGPLWEQEGTLIADLDMSAIARSKFDFDVTGHYARPDVFKLEVDESSRSPVQ
jgi:nitrilase